MANALIPTKKGKAELAEQISFTQEQLQLMKDTVARGATDNEFMLFLHLAKTYALDPFAKEIWCLKYGSNQPATVFTSRDGYLKIASRDPQMDGIQSDVVCASDVLEKLADGRVNHTYGSPRGAVIGAYALVYRKDRTVPAYFYASFSEYSTGNNSTWKKYPSAMIVKVAEAMALKRAFSISGLVTQEEIGLDLSQEPEAGTYAQEVATPPAAAPAPAEPLVTYSLADAIKAVLTVASREAMQQLWPHLEGHRGEPVFDLVSTATRLRWAAPAAGTDEQVETGFATIGQRTQAHKQLASHKNDAYRLEALHLLIKPDLTFSQASDLVDTSLANLSAQPERVAGTAQAKKAPVVTPAPGQQVGLATAAQKEEIFRLLNEPVITRQEKTKMISALPALTEQRAAQSITKLRKAVEQRETSTAIAA